MLEELQGSIGLLLWQLARDVHLQAELPREHRADLRAPGAQPVLRALLAGSAPDAALRTPLERLIQGEGDPAEVCSEVALLAGERGWRATAAVFARAAALLSPEDAGAALRAGRAARRGGDPAAAEGWSRRCLALARRSDRWAVYTAALQLLAEVADTRGDAEGAGRLRSRARRTARRHGVSLAAAREVGS